MTPSERSGLLSRLRTEPEDSAAAMLVVQLMSDWPSQVWIDENLRKAPRSYGKTVAREPVVHCLVSTENPAN